MEIGSVTSEGRIESALILLHQTTIVMIGGKVHFRVYGGMLGVGVGAGACASLTTSTPTQMKTSRLVTEFEPVRPNTFEHRRPPDVVYAFGRSLTS